MKWDEGHESPDVIDRRGAAGGGGIGGGLLAFAPLLLRSPLGAVVLVAIVGVTLLARTFGTSGKDAPDGQTGQPVETTGADVRKGEDREEHFVSFVLDDTQKTWDQIFTKSGRHYEKAKLVLFTDQTNTACGYGESATGPFYCPSDERVYIDLSFYDELSQKFGAKGDCAQAYVVAHEIGHHIQRQLGAAAAVRGLRRSERQGEASTSVRLELQADCYAGIWARSSQERGLLDVGDVDEALTAAASIGDDRLQKQARGRVSPESFTHGTSEQRVRWLKTGMTKGDLQACDTLNAVEL